MRQTEVFELLGCYAASIRSFDVAGHPIEPILKGQAVFTA
jgi:hypothetical protein